MHRSGLIELEVVLAIVRRGSFRGAAKELGMSATAISSAVAGLEARLSVRLFHRTTRSVALTEVGQRYVARIAPALAEIRHASEEITSQPGEPSGTLRINASPESASMLFDSLFARYLQRYPQMRLEIVTEARMVDIVADGFDAGIRLAESVPQDMIAVPLSEDIRLVVVATPDYFARHGKPQMPKDLKQHAGICMRMSHGGIYRWEFERRGQVLEVEVPPRLVFTDMRVQLSAVRAGFGVAYAAEMYIKEDLQQGRLVQVLDEWCQPFGGL